MRLKIVSVNVQDVNTGMKIEVYGAPFGYSVRKGEGVQFGSELEKQLNDPEFKNRISKIIREG